jgi:hypothetical protein
MKRSLYIIFFFIISLLGYIIFRFVWQETYNLNTLYLVPKDAIYIVQSDDPIGTWQEVRDSEIWKHLRSNTYFADLTKNANNIDTLLQENKILFDLLGKKKIWVSAHVLPNETYDHLYIIDLAKTSRFTDFKTILKKIITQHYTLTDRKYQDIDMLELFDEKTRETLYIAVIDNNLLLSYTPQLVEAAIAQRAEPVIGRNLHFKEVNKKINTRGNIRLYVQWQYLDEFASIFDFRDNGLLKNISKTLYFTGLDVALNKGVKVTATGFTNLNELDLSYLLALQKAGTGKLSIEKIAPLRTGAYLNFGFDSYQKFYDSYLELQAKNPDDYRDFQENKEQIENLLKIDLQKNFIDWIDDEVALLQFEPETFGNNNDFALVIKAKDDDGARKNLNFIAEQVRKRTPVKFKEVAYRGQTITFMSVKGFFKFFFGGFFKKLDNPYFTILDDYVIFTNSPNTLKYIINNYLDNNTLSQSDEYQKFKKAFDSQSNIFVYINTPRYYDSFVNHFTGSTRSNLVKNKDYFTGFTQIGFQLFPKDEVFKSSMAIQYQPWETLETFDEFTGWDIVAEEMKDTEEVLPQNAVKKAIEIPKINPNDFNAKMFIKKYPNGVTQYEVALKDGKKHGRFLSFYANGKIDTKGRFKNDKPTGIWKKYNEKGDLIQRKKY